MKPVVFSLVAAMVGLSTFVAAQAMPYGEPTAGPPTCVEVRAEVRYGSMGYDHIVHLNNICEHAQICTVTTSVNPDPIEAAVPGHREIEVVTFRGSPAREFVPHVVCHVES